MENSFTFLGMRDYRLAEGGLGPVEGSGPGILRDPDLKVLRSGPTFVKLTPQHAAFMASDEPLLVTKANVRARVHMDHVSIKTFATGKATGELRIGRLFTAQALVTPLRMYRSSGARLPR